MLPDLLPDADGPNNVVRGRHGYVVYNRNDTVVGLSIKQYGEYFESEVEVFRGIVQQGMQVADIGANIGTHSLALARLVGPTGRVYAFEPQRVVHQMLCATMAINGILHADCERMAVSDAPGEMNVADLDFTRPNNYGGLALGGDQGRPVPVVTLDDYLDGRTLHFIKADVQGMEARVVRGARRTIAAHRPVLYLECDQPDDMPALGAVLREIGYTAYWHLPRFFRPANHAGNATNVYAVGWTDAGGPHLACIGFAINLLCVPPGSKVEGLLPLLDDHPLHRAANRFHPAMPRDPAAVQRPA